MSTTHVIPEEYKNRVSSPQNWREIVEIVDELPPMPQIAARALQLADEPNTTAKELSDFLCSDIAMVTKVVRLANSVIYGQHKQITTLQRAILTVGYKSLKGIILATVLKNYNRGSAVMDKMIWENSLCTAISASIIAKTIGRVYGEEVFLLGLLHSVGQLALISVPETASEYKRVLDLVTHENHDYVTAEFQVFGYSHSLIGALLAKKWNFSEETCRIILHHADPLDDEPLKGLREEQTAVVKLANEIAHISQIGSPLGYPNLMEEALKTAEYLGFRPQLLESEVSNLITATQERYERDKQLYEV